MGFIKSGVRQLIFGLFLLFGVGMSFISLFLGKIFLLMGIVSLVLAYLVGFYYDSFKGKKAKSWLLKHNGKQAIKHLNAAIASNKYSTGCLMLTEDSLAYLHNGTLYEMLFSDIETVGNLAEDTGRIVNTHRHVGSGVVVGNSTAIKQDVLYIEGIKNGEPYSIKWVVSEMFFKRPKLNNFYKELKRVGNYGSSLDKHKVN